MHPITSLDYGDPETGLWHRVEGEVIQDASSPYNWVHYSLIEGLNLPFIPALPGEEATIDTSEGSTFLAAV